MSVLEFIAQMTKAIAWPAAAVVVALVFKGQIMSLFDRDKGSLNVGPIGVAWEGLRREVESELKMTPESLEPSRPAKSVSGSIDELLAVAQSSPEAAILEAFSRVERALRDKLGDDEFGSAPLVQLVGAALDRKLITDETARAIDGLRIMRNLAAHGRADELTKERAIDYLVLVDAVLYAMGNKPNM